MSEIISNAVSRWISFGRVLRKMDSLKGAIYGNLLSISNGEEQFSAN